MTHRLGGLHVYLKFQAEITSENRFNLSLTAYKIVLQEMQPTITPSTSVGYIKCPLFDQLCILTPPPPKKNLGAPKVPGYYTARKAGDFSGSEYPGRLGVSWHFWGPSQSAFKSG